MRFLLFRVKPFNDRHTQYLDIAAALRPTLNHHGGCEFIDRYRSLGDAAWMLSFQLWSSEAQIQSWRQDATHHAAQSTGRREVFEDYHLQIGSVIATDRAESAAPFHVPENAGRMVVMTEIAADPLPDFGQSVAAYESLYRPHHFALVAPVSDSQAATVLAAKLRQQVGFVRTLVGLVDREYGMFDREEAPQQWR
jgi:heme-degrading monooxygenase HmoA